MQVPLWTGLLIVCFFLESVSSQHTLPQRDKGCSHPADRVHWSDLSNKERDSYINATKCLQSKSSITGLSVSKNLFDDFIEVHIRLDDNIHNVAAMLPWHSGFVYAREIHLRQCGFEGRLPGWNWTKAADENDPFHDPIFDPSTGLGGNGDPETKYAVSSGPFSKFKVDLIVQNHDPVLSIHSLSRHFNSDDGNPHHGVIGFSDLHNSKAISRLMAMQSYQDFRQYVERPHSSVHDMIDGDMASVQSPNDPFFFLHHVRIDYLWRTWQYMNPDRRLMDYYGNRGNADEYDGPFRASLDDKLHYFNLIPDMRVRDVMNAQGSLLCYQYK